MGKDNSFNMNMYDVLGGGFGTDLTIVNVPSKKDPLSAAAEHVLARYNQGKVEDAVGNRAFSAYLNRNAQIADPLLGTSFSKAALAEIPGKGTASCSLDVPSRLREMITDAPVTAECSLPNGEKGTASQPRANRSSMLVAITAAP